jgi:hypothetical protein
MIHRFLLFLLLLVMMPDESLFAGDPVAGIITRVRGQVMVRKTGSETDSPLKVGDRIIVGHFVETAKDSGAQLVFTDDSFVDILPGTTLQVKQYEFLADADINRRTAVIKVSTGRARFVVYKMRSRDSRFAVETDHALVSAGKSDFFITASPSETEIVNIGQSLTVKNVSYLTVGEVVLGANQKTTVKEKTPPAQPATVPPELRRKYLKYADS